MAKKRFGLNLPHETYDTLYRMKYETMIDSTKIITKLIDDYLINKGYEIRLNTDEENEKIFGKK